MYNDLDWIGLTYDREWESSTLELPDELPPATDAGFPTLRGARSPGFVKSPEIVRRASSEVFTMSS